MREPGAAAHAPREGERIAVVVPQFLGGMPISGYHQARVLHEQGHEVLFIRPRRPSGVASPWLAETHPLACRQLEFHTVPAFPGRQEARSPSWRGARQIDQALRAFSPTLVLFHDPELLIPYLMVPVGPKPIAGLASARSVGAHCVALAHTLTERYIVASHHPLIRLESVRRFVRWRWAGFFNRNFTNLVIGNEALTHYYRGLGVRLPIHPAALCGVDLDVFAPGPRPDGGALRVIFVARLTLEKGAQHLPAFHAGLRERVPDAELVICGDGPLRGALEAALPRSAGARFTGWLPPEELAGELRGSSLLLSLCTTETHGMAADEALACGTPVFVPRSPGFHRFEGAGLGRVYPAEWLAPGGLHHLADAVAGAPAELPTWSARAAETRPQLGWDAVQTGLLAQIEAGRYTSPPPSAPPATEVDATLSPMG
jgi:glycosyltransferase involved in cell wall biosynthesis